MAFSTHLDYKEFGERVAARYEGQGAPPSWPRVLAEVTDAISSDLQAAWVKHIERLAVASHQGNRAAAEAARQEERRSRAAARRQRARQRAAQQPAAGRQGAQRRPRRQPQQGPPRGAVGATAERGLCAQCNVVRTRHNRAVCRARGALHARIHDVCRGGDPARVPGWVTAG